MATYTLPTNRLARDFNRALHLHLRRTVGNYNATKWDGLLSSNDVDITNGGIKDSVIAAFKTTWETHPIYSGWNFTKHVSNPLIAQEYTGGLHEFYPPLPIYEGPGDFKIMGKVYGQGYQRHSSDLVTWVDDGLVLPNGGEGTGGWEDVQSSPNVVKKIGLNYECLYAGYWNPAAPSHKIGHASSSTWGVAMTKNPSNPVYRASNYNDINGTNWDGILCTGAVYITDRWWYFGSVFNNSYTLSDLVYGVGAPGAAFSAVVLDTKICSASDLGPDWIWTQSIVPFRHPVTNKWMATVTLGNLVQNGSTDNQATYCFASDKTDFPIFTANDFICKPILYPDVSKVYEANYNYAACFLVDNAGNLIPVGGDYKLLYAGHDARVVFDYTGATCLASITSIPQK